MAEIKAVIFDMYQTLVQDPSGQWRRSFKTIIEDQGLAVTAEELWQVWHKSEEQFRLRRTDPSLPFQTYFDAWAGGFRLAFETLWSARRRRRGDKAIFRRPVPARTIP